jgi:hypothetical protein
MPGYSEDLAPMTGLEYLLGRSRDRALVNMRARLKRAENLAGYAFDRDQIFEWVEVTFPELPLGQKHKLVTTLLSAENS